MYVIINQCNLISFLYDHEIFALFVSSICHDLDHRGMNNAYMALAQHPISKLYDDESVLEKHHFSQTVLVLNTEGNNILENLSRERYEVILDLIQQIILATDLKRHFDLRPTVEKLAAAGNYDKLNWEHRYLLLCTMITSTDLCAITKPWEISKKVAELIYEEFFQQGERERMFGKTPMAMMDREKAEIPKLQLDFIDFVAKPVYVLLYKLIGESSAPLLNGINANRIHWENWHNEMKKQQQFETTVVESPRPLVIPLL